MSAIGGIVGFQNHKLNTSALTKLLESMQGRGQDTQTLWQSGNIGFVHKQLFTTLESRHECQPLVVKDKGLTLTADARIDNRDELMSLLGYDNNSMVTDADLILAAYQRWDSNCVEYLIGDFAFAIWDKRAQKLFCARDHLGVKPFCYLQDKLYFYFASQVSALFSASGVNKQANISGIQDFLEDKMLACEATFFERAKRLPAGHVLILENDQIQISRYWFPETIKIDEQISFDEAKNKFYTLLQQAVTVRLRNAGNTGCELSGGLDSSTILALAVKKSQDNKIIAFASTYSELACDENIYIQSMSEKLSIKPVFNRSEQLDYAGDNSLDAYYQLAPDWPGSGSFLDILGVCKNAKASNVRVILTGQGGDHITTGDYYMLADFFKSCQLKHLYGQLKACNFNYNIIRNYLLVPLLPETLKRLLLFILRKPQSLCSSEEDFCFPLHRQATRSIMQKIELSWLIGTWNQLWMDINPYNAIGGHYDIEFRHPFFDKRVVEFMLSLPPLMKFDGNQTKIILREAMKNELPDQIYKRDDKAEFTPIIRLQLELSLDDGSYKSLDLQQGDVGFRKLIYNFSQDDGYINKVWKEVCMAKWLRRSQ